MLHCGQYAIWRFLTWSCERRLPVRLLECLRFGTAMAAHPVGFWKTYFRAAYRRILGPNPSTPTGAIPCLFQPDRHAEVRFAGLNEGELDGSQTQIGEHLLDFFERSDPAGLRSQFEPPGFQGFRE